jgi:hypothetical protein
MSSIAQQSWQVGDLFILGLTLLPAALGVMLYLGIFS